MGLVYAWKEVKMSLVFIVEILLIFAISTSLTVITMEFFKPALWVWHIVNPVYFLIICFMFFGGN